MLVVAELTEETDAPRLRSGGVVRDELTGPLVLLPNVAVEADEGLRRR